MENRVAQYSLMLISGASDSYKGASLLMSFSPIAVGSAIIGLLSKISNQTKHRVSICSERMKCFELKAWGGGVVGCSTWNNLHYANSNLILTIPSIKE